MMRRTLSSARTEQTGGTKKQTKATQIKREKEKIKMRKTMINALRKFHRGEKGVTGLETAIILIAFVTVAAVLAYSVLSAGIFSAERGQEAVYSGLAQAQSSMQVRGSVYALCDEPGVAGTVDKIQFTLASVLADQTIDMGNVIINYSDASTFETAIAFNTTLLGDVTDPSSPMLGPHQVMLITVDADAIDPDLGLGAYATFTLQVIPPRGAAITIKRTLPGEILAVTDLF